MLSHLDRKRKGRLIEKLHKTRIGNMRALVANFGSHAELARRLAVSPEYIFQLCGVNPVRSISEKTARDVEEKLALTAGWLDIDRGNK